MRLIRLLPALIVANALALFFLLGAKDLNADGGFWCEPEEGSEWCRCVEDGPWLPGGCWEYPAQIEVDCFRQHHCEEPN